MEKKCRVIKYKLVLAGHSSVFETMLDMDDTKEVTKGHLVISDVSTEAVEVMLKHMYTKEDVEDEEITFDLLELADKYDLKSLMDECIPKFIQKIDLGNCLEVYNFAFLHNLDPVMIGAFHFIKSKWNQIKHEKYRREKLHPKASEELIDMAMDAHPQPPSESGTGITWASAELWLSSTLENHLHTNS